MENTDQESIREAELYYGQGNDYLLKENYAYALVFFNLALKRFPPEHGRIPDILINTGYAHLGLGECADALTCFDTALTQNRYNSNAWKGKAMTQLMLAQFTFASQSFQKAADIAENNYLLYSNPSDIKNAAECWEANGFCLEKLARAEEADSSYNKSADAYCRIGVILADESYDYQSALGSFNAALRAAPHSIRARIGKANILYKLNHLTEACDIFEELLSENSQNIEAFYRQVKLLHNDSNSQSSVFLFGRIASVWEGKACAASSNSEAAIWRKKAVDAYISHGIALLESRENKHANVVFNHVLKSDPHNEIALGYKNILEIPQAKVLAGASRIISPPVVSSVVAQQK